MSFYSYYNTAHKLSKWQCLHMSSFISNALFRKACAPFQCWWGIADLYRMVNEKKCSNIVTEQNKNINHLNSFHLPVLSMAFSAKTSHLVFKWSGTLNIEIYREIPLGISDLVTHTIFSKIIAGFPCLGAWILWIVNCYHHSQSVIQDALFKYKGYQAIYAQFLLNSRDPKTHLCPEQSSSCHLSNP